MTLHSRKLVHRQDAFSGKMVSRCGMVEEWRSRKRDLGENSRPSSASMGKGTLVNLGNACSGFVTIDEDTADHRNFQWARVLVKARGRNFPGSKWREERQREQDQGPRVGSSSKMLRVNGSAKGRVSTDGRMNSCLFQRSSQQQKPTMIHGIHMQREIPSSSTANPRPLGLTLKIHLNTFSLRLGASQPSSPRLCSGASSSPSSGGDVFATVGDFCLAQRGGLVKSILHVEEKPLKMIMKDGRAFDLFDSARNSGSSLVVIPLGSQGLNLVVESSELKIETHLGCSFYSKRFKKEILALLRKMEDRQRKKAPISGKRNFIGRIKINGEWVTEKSEIATKIVHYFKLLLLELVGEWRPSINGLLLKSLSNEKEVFKALMDLNRDKPPGPNGFSLAF
uniref:Uncharacterized protein n=1 Tax=Vitis vinifera TaxID=29760 RepID=A5AEW4_VITVI|nr:hypothetical protein VITISV_030633 [Vitis vinifera]